MNLNGGFCNFNTRSFEYAIFPSLSGQSGLTERDFGGEVGAALKRKEESAAESIALPGGKIRVFSTSEGKSPRREDITRERRQTRGGFWGWFLLGDWG